MTNLVSIIVPVYNCKPYLEDCIQSVLAQDYGNLELLLIDDGSTDGSGQICDQYAHYDKLRVIHQKNQGVSATRNTGIRLASGDLILFLDSDDTIEPSMVSTMVADIEKEQADCAFCGMIHDYPRHPGDSDQLPGHCRSCVQTFPQRTADCHGYTIPGRPYDRRRRPGCGNRPTAGKKGRFSHAAFLSLQPPGRFPYE